MKSVNGKAQAVAPTNTTVLLYGETGTGKGVLAGLIHSRSNRSGHQFIQVHCGAIPDTLLESDLFGHEKGAFTGATKRRLGKFEIARGGTIFLDEIGTISSSAQVKMLQVLQDKTFLRVGGDTVINADTRIIAATNTDLKKKADEGTYRRDLYYRLNVFPIEVPPLRETKTDIPLLTDHFLNRLNALYSKNIHAVHPDVMQAFDTYDWPGNIRELENLMERSYILETSSVLSPESFPGELFAQDSPAAQIPFDMSQKLADVRRKAVENIERQYLKELLMRNKGRIAPTAKSAGISSRQLHKLMTKYQIQKKDFKRTSSSDSSVFGN